ncbi:hypothetical protein [Pseudoduganella albidiflava]|uniref:Uncharacterized protein n=1 Tax=Pseudoduganella albidiflava TaxID=321983 RepID=A0A411WXA1_9BURK|nr:hypothetical protein [Pseudoduganella albidiflava]QBI01365.1 hypothetical protein EYF70_11275 [Pseudoduganella albidiflava]GGY36232.1 hypothetical protein GCM10007387_18180 [Pseudoduganella albidiflava]
MRFHLIFTILFAIHLPALCGSKSLPRDIKVFVANAQACEHLGGEYDGELPEDQKREIERNVRKYCGAASRQLRALRTRYQRDPAMLAVIENHANDAVTDYR